MLLASSTTEGQNGGNIRFSSAAVERAGTEISLVRNATVISYGAQADGIVTIARRDNDAAGSDQVLLAITKDDYSLTRSLEWETLGMRGTCSAGFELKFNGSSEQIFPEGGGMLIRDDHGDVIGAVGVTGDTEDRDEELAIHGIHAAGLKTDEDCRGMGRRIGLLAKNPSAPQ